MKKTVSIMGGIVLSFIGLPAVAQQTWETQKNPTVDSITAKYKDKLVTAPVAPTQDKIFPVIGQYESATNPETASVTVSLDAQNKGMIWIEGLPQGRVKGLLANPRPRIRYPHRKMQKVRMFPKAH